MSSRLDSGRAEELACDAALFGLEVADERELASLSADDLRLDLELAAAEIALLELDARGALTPLPKALEAKVVADLSAEKATLGPLKPAVSSLPRRPAAAVSPERGQALLAWVVAAAALILAAIGWLRRPDERARLEKPTTTLGVDAGPATVAALDAGGEKTTRPRSREALLALAGTSRTDWKPTKDDAGVHAAGDVVWHSGVQEGVMRFEGLAPNDPARFQYQLWIFDETRDDKHPVDGGVFDVGSSGEALVPIAAKLKVRKAKLFAVTIEPPGGVVVSKRERIVLTAQPPPT